MRSEQEMFDLILNIAKTDQRVRAVYMNGSRANPKLAKDRYQDFDIVFVVSETLSFLADKNWISLFGELAIAQEPYSNNFAWGKDHDCSGSYTWLMLFTDGNRIDLSIKIIECALEDYLADTLCIKLLDKDNILSQIPEPNDSLYYTKPPTKQKYAGCCNEFWWCLNNVAKAIARDQIPYAQKMYIETVHSELEKMLEWHIAIQYNFMVTTGKWGKYFKKYLTSELYEQYIKTYSDSDNENLWRAIFNACDLFRSIAKQVAKHFDYHYKEQDDDNIMNYLLKIKNNSL